MTIAIKNNDDDQRPAVIDGEIVASDAAPARGRRVIHATAVVRRQTVNVVTHDRTKATVKGAGRNLWYVVAGTGLVVARYRDTHGSSRYERMMRAAEAVGDQAALMEWEARDVAEKARRHQRVMDWVTSPVELVKALGLGIVAVVGLLLVLGIVLAIGTGDVSQVIGPIVGLITAITWTAWFLTAYGALMLLGATAGALAYLWHLGRTRTTPPAWIAPSGLRPVDDTVTPSKVVLALRNLGISALTKAIKAMDDAGGAMLSPIRTAGCGVEVDVRLPSGVSTAEIQKLRRKLAENLDRHEYEVFITIPAARTVRLWIADSGALDEPIGPSPLVIDPDGIRADIYTGRAPWGQDLRGDARGISPKQRHLLITGLSNQGKTASLRALVLWAVFDVTAEFRIADLKGVGDWHMFDGLATELIEGPSDEHVIAATEMLEEVVREMERRLGSLDKDRYPNGVTRDLARKPGSGFHPLFAVVDEAQQAFMCPVVDPEGNPYGGTKARSRYFMAARKIHNQGRAVNVHLWQGTQDPTDQNLPKLVREGAHIRASLVVGTEAQARMALGDKAVDGGAAPHLLRQGVDKGTLVLNGEGMDLAPGESSIILRTHFIGGDEATELAARAKALRAKAGRIPAPAQEEAAPEVDHLAVIVEVMAGRKHLKRTDLLAALHERDLSTYGTWETKTLANFLDGAGVPVATVKGYPCVRLSDLLTVQANRLLAAEADTDDPDDLDDEAIEADTDGYGED
jgi:S-DNA-T family DNA segregation ATPase FtsK/SpoIIIE